MVDPIDDGVVAIDEVGPEMEGGTMRMSVGGSAFFVPALPDWWQQKTGTGPPPSTNG